MPNDVNPPPPLTPYPPCRLPAEKKKNMCFLNKVNKLSGLRSFLVSAWAAGLAKADGENSLILQPDARM